MNGIPASPMSLCMPERDAAQDIADQLGTAFDWMKTVEGVAYWTAVRAALLRIAKEGR